jgi:hypothetical protein
MGPSEVVYATKAQFWVYGHNPSPGLRARGEPAADAKLQEIAQLPIQIVDVGMELTKLAASLKAAYNLPYADCFAAARAQGKGDLDYAAVITFLEELAGTKVRAQDAKREGGRS